MPFTSSHPQNQPDHDLELQPRETKTVRHRLPRRKVEEVWKPLSDSSCNLVHDNLQKSISSGVKDEVLERVQRRAKLLTSKMRVPVGVYSGIKLNQDGQVEMMSIGDLMEKNRELEAMITRKERERETRRC
ncbi:hypothetical protein CROQUDRAFT_665144 [Cronartium quercuum f. sp. fusiforme G11]|uniref:Uncharacterized protein n=1 Tax=Cronartium quercuum f. sp. fusiforme G11 TaxID=708437 RepID=A0A9P6T6E0_9BASI|nr:hypothetical protein CROQUDRAFT_665144 [Cronartium quercuum f. sp. fusiforme G11]